MERPIEADLRVALAAVEVGLDWRVVGDAGRAVDLGLIRDRVDGRRGREGGDDVDPGVQEEVLGDLRGPVGVGLAVPQDDLEGMVRPVDLEVAARRRLHLGEHERQVLGEEGKLAGLRGDEADLEGLRHGEGRPQGG